MQKVIKNIKTISIWHVLFIALIFRLILIEQSFWLDEASQAVTSLRSVNEIIFSNTKDFHPPLSYIFSHYWILFGQSEIWLRLLPVLFSILTIYVGYLFAAKLFSKKTGLLFAELLAMAPYYVYYSQEFRMYSQATFLGMLSMYFFIHLLEEKRSKYFEMGFVLSTLLLLYTHYMGGFIVVAQLIYLFMFNRSIVTKYLSLLFFVSIGFVFWVPILFQQLSLGVRADEVLPGWSSMLSLSAYKALPLLFVKFVIGRIDFDNTVLYLSVIGAAFGILVYPIYSLRNKFSDKKTGLLMLWFLIPVLLTFLISFKVPMFQPFRLLFVLPAFFLLIAYGCFEIKKYRTVFISLVIGLLLFCQALFWFNQSFWREDWRSAVLAADEFTSDTGMVLFAFEDEFVPYTFYSDQRRGIGVIISRNGERIIRPVTGMQKLVYFSYLSQLTDPEKDIELMLSQQGYRLLETKDFRGVGFVHFYVSADQLIGKTLP